MPEDIGLALGAFAVSAVIGTTTASVIHDEAYAEFSDIEGTAPAAICKTSDLPVGLAKGDSLVIGAVSYEVCGIEPDYTGVTVLRLEKIT
jgi:hypothetical protein